MRRALVALVTLAILGTGAALAVPVPVVSVSDGEARVVSLLRDGEAIEYRYRQSIYGVIVHEQFVRTGDRLDLRRVVAADIRALEYFRWDTAIRREGDAYVTEPPATSVSELVIRVTAAGEQDLRSAAWRLVLRDRFGERVVRVTLGRPALLPTFLGGLVW